MVIGCGGGSGGGHLLDLSITLKILRISNSCNR